MLCFGYGSLMWDGWEKKFEATRIDGAILRGFCRSFSKASILNWGTKEHPGPTLGLDPLPNGVVVGVAFEFSEKWKDRVFEELRAREGSSFSFESHALELPLSVEPVMGLVPINNRQLKTYIGALPLARRASMAKVVVGTSGACVDYVVNLYQELLRLGIKDSHVEQFASLMSEEKR